MQRERPCPSDKLYDTLSKAVIVTNDGEIKWALKARIDRDPEAGILKISQELYINEVLDRFGIHSIEEADTPAYSEGPNSRIEEEECVTDPKGVAALHAK